jgi:hypothetical protein
MIRDEETSPEIATTNRVMETQLGALALQEVCIDKAYWLTRNRASLELAKNASNSEARLAQYDLAGRYSVKAANAGMQAVDLAESLPPPIYEGGTSTRATDVDHD